MALPALKRSYILHALLTALLAGVFWRTIKSPQSEFGDGREYVLQTQAIVFDGSLAVEPAHRAQYFNDTNPFNVRLDAGSSSSISSAPDQDAEGEGRQFGARFGSLYLASDGTYRYIHAWVYSLAVAPVYWVLHQLAPGAAEYFAFRLVNLLALFVPLVALWRRRPSVTALLFLIVVLASPVTPHLQFAHPEVFCLGCVLLSFLGINPRWSRPLSAMLLGLGAAQNIPIALFFPLHLWLMWQESGFSVGGITLRRVVRAFVPYVFAALIPAGMLAYNYAHFGTFNLIAHLGQADFAFLSARKILSVFVSPMIGCFWYMPASWLAIFVALARRQYRAAILFALSVVAVATLSSTTANINSAQLSACRYAVWYLGPLYLLPFLFPSDRQASDRTREAIAWSLGLCVVGLVWLQLGTWRFLAGESYRFFSSQRAVPEVAALYRLFHFHDDIEPLVENIKRSEIPVAHRFRGIYVWNLGEGESLWIVSQRAMNASRTLEVRADRDLATSQAVLKDFGVSTAGDGRYVLTLRDDAAFSRHPYLGGYLMLWVPARVEGMRSAAPVTIVPATALIQ